MEQTARTEKDLPVTFLREVTLRDVLNDPHLKRTLHNLSVVEEISKKPGFLGDFWERVQRTYNQEREDRARQAMEECKALGKMPLPYSLPY